MSEESVTKELCMERHTRSEHRLEKHGDLLDELRECTVKLTQMLVAHDEKLENHESRIDTLEKKPAGFLDKIIGAAISALVAAVVAALI